MSNRDPEATYDDPVQSVEFAIQEWVRANLRTSVPGIVRAYDARTMRARVQPALRAIVTTLRADEAMDRAPIYDVPVMWQGGGGFVAHFNLVPGDLVWLMFSERGIGEFKRTLTLADPPPMVMFQTRDAVALPYRGEAITPAEGTTGDSIQAVTPTADGSLTSVVGATIQSDDGAVYVNVIDGRVKARAPSIVLDGDVQVTGSLAVDGATLTHGATNVGRDHMHTGVTAGGAVTGPPQP